MGHAMLDSPSNSVKHARPPPRRKPGSMGGAGPFVLREIEA